MKEARKIQPMKPRPVPGAGAFWALFAAFLGSMLAAVVTGRTGYFAVMASVYVVGAAIVSTVRLIEADRRAGL